MAAAGQFGLLGACGTETKAAHHASGVVGAAPFSPVAKG